MLIPFVIELTGIPTDFFLPLAAPTLTWSRLHCSNKADPAHPRVLTTGDTRTDKRRPRLILTSPSITNLLANMRCYKQFVKLFWNWTPCCFHFLGDDYLHVIIIVLQNKFQIMRNILNLFSGAGNHCHAVLLQPNTRSSPPCIDRNYHSTEDQPRAAGTFSFV